MHVKVSYLFDPTKYERVKTPNQQEFERSNLQLMLAMEDAVYGAQDLYEKNIRPLFKDDEADKMLQPIALISFIRQYFIVNYPAYCRAATKSRFKLITETGECIYLKKLNRNKRPSNIETHANNLILHQVTEGRGDKNANIFFGYTRKDKSSPITGVYAVCLEGKEMLWATNISSLRIANSAKIETITPAAQTVLKPGVVALRKKDNKKE